MKTLEILSGGIDYAKNFAHQIDKGDITANCILIAGIVIIVIAFLCKPLLHRA